VIFILHGEHEEYRENWIFVGWFKGSTFTVPGYKDPESLNPEPLNPEPLNPYYKETKPCPNSSI